jgi:hypothetical protein
MIISVHWKRSTVNWIEARNHFSYVKIFNTLHPSYSERVCAGKPVHYKRVFTVIKFAIKCNTIFYSLDLKIVKKKYFLFCWSISIICELYSKYCFVRSFLINRKRNKNVVLTHKSGKQCILLWFLSWKNITSGFLSNEFCDYGWLSCVLSGWVSNKAYSNIYCYTFPSI